MRLRRNLGETYSPVYFLASLGNGGLAVAFYVYLHFMVKHLKLQVTHGEETFTAQVPMATFGAIKPLLTGDSKVVAAAVALALLGIIVFAARHYFFLIWNLQEFNHFKGTAAHAKLMRSNAEISRAAIPLTLAMSINVFFVLCGVFVPGLWDFVEYLFPVALVGFLAVGIYALQIFVQFMARILATGNFERAENNNLNQMISVFAFAMVGVGFAAPAAMSTNLITSSLGIIGSMFFTSAAVLIGLQSLFLGFLAMMEHGINRENSPTMWVVVPIVTLIGISLVRVDHGLHMNLNVHTQPGEMFPVIFFLFSLQVLFAVMGWYVMKQVDYFGEYLNGPGRSPTSYALICPGVAFFVYGMFMLQMALVRLQVVPKFGVAYWILLGILAAVQVVTIVTLIRLDRKLLFD